MAVQFRVDRREFTETLRQYSKLSKRDPKVISDTKAYYISRRATVETPKADAAKIRAELGRVVMKGKKEFKLRLRKIKVTRNNRESEVPLAALIINKRLGKGNGLHGESMKEAIRKLIGSRLRSIAFLKSGWLPAIKILQPLAERIGGKTPRLDRSAKQYGRPKGTAIPAKLGWTVQTVIENAAGGNKNNKGALLRYGGPALQAAFDAETSSMKEYIERKMLGTARKAGIKAHG